MSLLDILGRGKGPGLDRPALRLRSGAVSRGEVWSLASRLAGQLREAGVGEGQRVALLLPNSAALVAALFAPAFLDAAVVPLDCRLAAPEVAACLEHSGAAAVVADPRLAEVARDAARLAGAAGGAAAGVPVVLPQGRGPALEPPARPAGPALYCYTSGSTGRPKGVEFDHPALAGGAADVAASLGLGSGDRTLAAIPLSHSYGFAACLLPSLLAGAEVVVLERPAPGALLWALGEQGATYFPGVPFLFEFLLRCHRPPGFRLDPHLLCFSAGSPLDPAVSDLFTFQFRAYLGQEYGTSETGPVSADLGRHLRRPASVGLPLQGVRVRVVDASGRDAPPGVAGEVAVQGRGMGRGYLGPSGRESGRFLEGWFFTGDRGYVDSQGYLHLVGRGDRVINLDGLKVEPAEVERVLLDCPGVAEAVVVEGWLGQRPVVRAVLAPRGRADAEAVRSFCRERLAPWKVPEIVEFRDELPRSPLGKVALDRILRAGAPGGPGGTESGSPNVSSDQAPTRAEKGGART